MEMTYAALAKSLGLTLKSSSSSTSTTSSAGKELAAASTPTLSSASAPISLSKLQTPPPDQLIVTRDEENIPNESETEKEKERRDEASPEASPIPPRLSREPEVKEEENGEGVAAGDAESDIASSRRSSPSPVSASVQEGSTPKENSTEATESQSTNPSSVSQGMDVDASNVDTDVISDKSVFSTPLTIADKDMTDEQLHHAKVLILDLLGWGVPPEYLLQRGVSHALLYTVFTDLRLRLPESIIADCIRLVSTPS